MSPGRTALTTREAAEVLGAHVETVRRLARRGEIPAFKVGKDWRFDEGAIRRWALAQRLGAEKAVVLVLDREAGFRDSMRLSLEGEGYLVATADSAAEALEIARRQTPTILLLDLRTTGCRGAEVLADLRKNHPELAVVAVVERPDSEAISRTLEHPPVTLLPRSAARELFVDTVHLLVDGAARRERGRPDDRPQPAESEAEAQ